MRRSIYIGTLRFLGDPHRIDLNECPSCAAPVYLVRRDTETGPETLWDSIELRAGQGAGNPSGTLHSCPNRKTL